jgi:hypothetical protein
MTANPNKWVIIYSRTHFFCKIFFRHRRRCTFFGPEPIRSFSRPWRRDAPPHLDHLDPAAFGPLAAPAKFDLLGLVA